MNRITSRSTFNFILTLDLVTSIPFPYKKNKAFLKYPRRVNILKKTVINNQTKNQILYYWIKNGRVYIRNLWVVIHVDQIALSELNWQISKDRSDTSKRWMNVNQWMYLCADDELRCEHKVYVFGIHVRFNEQWVTLGDKCQFVLAEIY